MLVRSVAVAALAALALAAAPATAATLTLERVDAPGAVANPIEVTTAPGDPGFLYALDRVEGTVTRIDAATGIADPEPFFRIPRVTDTPPGTFDPGGLRQAFSLAFDPGSDRFYVSYNDTNDDLTVIEGRRSATPGQAQNTAEILLTIEYTPVGPGTHYGGNLDFGPDGNLYLTTGDEDRPFDEVESQDPDSLKGKVLRLDTEDGSAEVVALGARNPFQAAFDGEHYYVADVGENAREEVTLIDLADLDPDNPVNLGWPGTEGDLAFRPDLLPDGVTLTDPLYVYGELGRPRNSISGGDVYRGDIEALAGRYVLADFASAEIRSFLPVKGPDGATFADEVIWDLASTGDDWLRRFLQVSFLDDGSLYVVTLDAGIFRVIDAERPADVPLPPAGLLLAGALAALGAVRTGLSSAPRGR